MAPSFYDLVRGSVRFDSVRAGLTLNTVQIDSVRGFNLRIDVDLFGSDLFAISKKCYASAEAFIPTNEDSPHLAGIAPLTATDLSPRQHRTVNAIYNIYIYIFLNGRWSFMSTILFLAGRDNKHLAVSIGDQIFSPTESNVDFEFSATEVYVDGEWIHSHVQRQNISGTGLHLRLGKAPTTRSEEEYCLDGTGWDMQDGGRLSSRRDGMGREDGGEIFPPLNHGPGPLLQVSPSSPSQFFILPFSTFTMYKNRFGTYVSATI